MLYEYANAYNYKYFKHKELNFQLIEANSMLFMKGCSKLKKKKTNNQFRKKIEIY